jgi:hypothetical protein
MVGRGVQVGSSGVGVSSTGTSVGVRVGCGVSVGSSAPAFTSGVGVAQVVSATGVFVGKADSSGWQATHTPMTHIKMGTRMRVFVIHSTFPSRISFPPRASIPPPGQAVKRAPAALVPGLRNRGAFGKKTYPSPQDLCKLGVSVTWWFRFSFQTIQRFSFCLFLEPGV